MPPWHIPVVERAYVSGGGAFTAQQTFDNATNRIFVTPVDPFQLTIDNYGKTPARVLHIEVGFCESSSIPPMPQYTITRLFNGVIPPGKEGAATGITFTRAQIRGDCIFGRFHYWDIFREQMRHSGFILHVTPGLGVEPIAAPAATLIGIEGAEPQARFTPGQWSDGRYDVTADGVAAGYIFKANAVPVGEPGM
jgi:hypothetical protein